MALVGGLYVMQLRVCCRSDVGRGDKGLVMGNSVGERSQNAYGKKQGTESADCTLWLVRPIGVRGGPALWAEKRNQRGLPSVFGRASFFTVKARDRPGIYSVVVHLDMRRCVEVRQKIPRRVFQIQESW